MTNAINTCTAMNKRSPIGAAFSFGFVVFVAFGQPVGATGLEERLELCGNRQGNKIDTLEQFEALGFRRPVESEVHVIDTLYGEALLFTDLMFRSPREIANDFTVYSDMRLAEKDDSVGSYVAGQPLLSDVHFFVDSQTEFGVLMVSFANPKGVVCHYQATYDVPDLDWMGPVIETADPATGYVDIRTHDRSGWFRRPDPQFRNMTFISNTPAMEALVERDFATKFAVEIKP